MVLLRTSAAVAAAAAVMALAELSATTSALDQKLFGINYDLRQGPDWDPNKCKDATTIATDLATLSQITTRLRTYSLSGCDVATVLTEAKKLKMTVWLGVWVAADESVFKKELDALNRLLDASLIDENVVGFNVGSEAVYRKDITAEQAVQYATDFKATLKKKSLSIPVSITDVADILLQYPSMIEASDVVTANQFPFWELVEASGAANQFKKRFQGLKNAAGSKKVIITETGWPTAGANVNGSEASGPNAARYLNDFVSLAKDQNWDYYYFAGFDSPYKEAQENDKNTVESHFGIYDVNRVMKPDYAALKVHKPESLDVLDASSNATDSKAGNTTDKTDSSNDSTSKKNTTTTTSLVGSTDSSSSKSSSETKSNSDLAPPTTQKKKVSSASTTCSVSVLLLSALLSVVFFHA